jgi:acetyltransferase-like isoleucine patch superfamily enzyme
MASLMRYLATSNDTVPRLVRAAHKRIPRPSLPAPRPVVVPLRWTYEAAREGVWLAMQHLICEPHFKSHCARYGARLRTGCYLHYVTGSGDIEVGDDVTLDGLVTIAFAARFADRPTLVLGDRTLVGHHARFTVGKRITLGSDVLVSPRVIVFDSPGHPSDPDRRRAGLPPDEDDVRPVTIEDNVFIGTQALVGVGVTIGENSVVAAGSVVLGDVPPNSVVAGNPARKIGVLRRGDAAEARAAAIAGR